MPKFPRFIPLSESAEEDSSSGSDEDSDDGSVTSRRTSDPFDEDFPDAQDQFTEDGLDTFALFDQAEEELFAKNPLPPLAGRSLATSTFGSSSATDSKKSSSSKKKRRTNKGRAPHPRNKSNQRLVSPQSQAHSFSAHTQNMSADAPDANGNVAELAHDLENKNATVTDSSSASNSSADESSPSAKNTGKPGSPDSAGDEADASPSGQNGDAMDDDLSQKGSRKAKKKRAADSGSSPKVASGPSSNKKIKKASSKIKKAPAQLKPTPPQTKEEKEAALAVYMTSMKGSDQKLNQKARLSALTHLRERVFVLRSNSEEQKRLIEQYKVQLDKTLREKAGMIAELKTLRLQMSHTVSRSKAKLLRVSQEQKSKAIAITKDALWRVRKFISCSDEEEWCAAFVLKRMNLPNMEPDGDNHWNWVETYKKVIKKKLFERRNYVTSEMKKLIGNTLYQQKHH